MDTNDELTFQPQQPQSRREFLKRLGGGIVVIIGAGSPLGTVVEADAPGRRGGRVDAQSTLGKHHDHCS